jgi:hypothetical protein
MPYIVKEKRAKLDNWIFALANSNLVVGELNYVISRLIYLWCRQENYWKLNEAVGVLECTKQEVYRKLVVPYEEDKCNTNGEVFE